MAKRFIETGFFKDPFVRGLQGAYKGLYIYLFLDCSNAGIWNVELDVARLRCDIPESCTDEDIKKAFSDKIIELEDGQKWLLKNFLKVQHNGILKQNNKAHTGAINELSKHGILEEIKEGEFALKDKKNQGASEGLTRPTGNGKGNSIGKGSGKSNGKGKKAETEKNEDLIFPWETETFKTQWKHWKIYKKKEFQFNYKSIQSEQAALNKLSNISKGEEKAAIKIIHEAMSNGWKGFFELKTTQNERTSKSNRELAESAYESEIGRNYRTQ